MNGRGVTKMAGDGLAVIKELNKGMKTLDQHMEVLSSNQLEFEKYLKDILERVKKLESSD